MKCPNCGFDAGSFKFCPECGTKLEAASAMQSAEHWSVQLSHDGEFWCEEMMEQGPSVIAYEYERLRKLLSQKQTYGAMLQMKDLAEDILKYACLFGLSYIWKKCKTAQKTNVEEHQREIELLAYAVAGPLELGRWRDTIAQELEACLPEGNLKKLVGAARSFMQKKCVVVSDNEARIDIVHWRNSSIGHGSLGYEENKEFQNEIKSLLKAFGKYFQENLECYKLLMLCKEQDSQSHCLVGSQNARNLEGETLFFSYEGEKVDVFPFILIYKKEIYFFDTFIWRVEKVDLLSYPGGNKKEIKKKKDEAVVDNVCEIYHFCEEYLKEIRYEKSTASEESPENSNYLIEMEEELNRYYSTENYEKNQYLEQWLEDRVLKDTERKKGVFLVQMREGMGKSAWARSYDWKVNKLTKSRPQWAEQVTTKVLYLNSVYNKTVRQITTGLEILLSHDSSNRLILREQEKIVLDDTIENKRERMAQYINDYYSTFTAPGRGIWQEKLLLVMDGLDETALDEENNIFEWIPQPEMLSEGIYLLLLCRTDAEMTEAKQNELGKVVLSVDGRLTVEPEEEHYQALLHQYVRKQLPQMEQKEQEKLLLDAGNRFSFLKIRMDIFKNMGEVDSEQLQSDVDCYRAFFKLLEKRYGDKHMKALCRLSYMIATAKAPLDYKELSVLMGEHVISFRLLGHLMDLKNFLLVSHEDTRFCLKIASESVQQYIEQQYEEEQENIGEQYLACLENLPYYYENEEQIGGVVYLLSNLAEFQDIIGRHNLKMLLNREYLKLIDEIACELLSAGDIVRRQKGYAIAENVLKVVFEMQPDYSMLEELYNLQVIWAKSYLDTARKTDVYFEKQMKSFIDVLEEQRKVLLSEGNQQQEMEINSMLAVCYNLLSRNYRAREREEEALLCHKKTIEYGEGIETRDGLLLMAMGDTYHNMMTRATMNKQASVARSYADKFRRILAERKGKIESQEEVKETGMESKADTAVERESEMENQLWLRYDEIALDVSEAEIAVQLDEDYAFVKRKGRKRMKEYLKFKEELEVFEEEVELCAQCLYLYLILFQIYIYVLSMEDAAIEEILAIQTESVWIMRVLEERYHYPLVNRIKVDLLRGYGINLFLADKYQMAYEAFRELEICFQAYSTEGVLNKREEKEEKQKILVFTVNCLLRIQSEDPINRGKASFPVLNSDGRCPNGLFADIREDEDSYQLNFAASYCKKCKEVCYAKETKGQILVNK